MLRYILPVAAALLIGSVVGVTAADNRGGSKSAVKSESFDRDPGWESYNNRVVPDRYPFVTQDFGFCMSNYAGILPGEMGGRVTRASEPAFYADRSTTKTLEDKLSASGSFALTKTTAGAGIFFGFFRAEQPGASGRPISSLGMDFDCEASGARLAVRLITAKNQSCGTFVTPFIPGKYRPTPIRSDGTRYAWTLDYDPQGAEGNGRFTFTLHGDAPKPGQREDKDLPANVQQEIHNRFPVTTSFTVDLPPGYKQQDTAFDHFGLMNAMKPGGVVSIYFDDLQYDGRSQDFSQDPHWDALGNHASYQSKDAPGAHDFGFSNTNFAGGRGGEVGGTFWRGGKYAYYADRVGPLSINDRLEARGKVFLKVGGPDADMYLGWFSSANKDQPPDEAGNFLGVHVGGPTRVGHYFQPSFKTASGNKFQAKTGPILTRGEVFDWSLVYDPNAEDGKGVIQVTLGKESVSLPLKKGAKAQGATFDRFGLFTAAAGGQMVKIYLDDLEYTAARGAQ